MSEQSLAMILFGEPSSGKSTMCGTAPKPFLVLDTEAGSKYVRAFKNKVKWNPLTHHWNEVYKDGVDAVVVNVLDYQTLVQAYEYLNNTEHPFKTVVIDSLTETQKRLVDAVAGTDSPTLAQWGTIGRHLEDLIRKFRDLTEHPKHPIQTVIFTCLAHLNAGQTRPYLKGSLELSLPAFVDVVAYLYAENVNGEMKHRTLLVPANNIIAKDRTGALVDEYGAIVEDANITEWLEVLEREFGGNE